MRAYFIVVAAILGSAGEIIVPIVTNRPEYNWGHIIIWLGFSLTSVCELLAFNKVVIEPMWSVLPAMGLSFISLMFQFHEQPRVYWLYLHLATSYATVPLIICYILWVVIGMYWLSSDQSWRNPAVAHTYTNPKPWSTPVPGLTAFFLCLQSMLWWEMWWNMGWYSTENLPPEIHHPEHKMLETIIKDIVIVIVILLSTSFVAKRLDGKRMTEHEYGPDQVFDIDSK